MFKKYDFKLIGKYALQAIVVGICGGLIGCLYNFFCSYVTAAWHMEGKLLFSIMMPIVGLLVIAVSVCLKTEYYGGSNTVMEEAGGTDTKMSPICSLASFLDLLLTNLAETVTGREGASWQLTAPIAKYLNGRFFKDTERRIAITCAIASGFGCIWGLPLFGAVIGSEMANGKLYFKALGPGLLSGLIARGIALAIYPVNTAYNVEAGFNLAPFDAVKLFVLAVAIGLFAKAYIAILSSAQTIFNKISNRFVRIFVGGSIAAILTYFFGQDYLCGVSTLMINALAGAEIPWFAFAAKVVFFAILFKAGYKTGILIQTFAIGSMLGSVLGLLFGLPRGLAAAVGLTSLFAASFNCPLAGIVLCFEIFDKNWILYLCLAVCLVIARIVSGKCKIYAGQKLK